MKKVVLATLTLFVASSTFAASIDGEYEYKNKPNPRGIIGSVEIKQIAPNKIKFDISTQSKNMDTCMAEGTATLVDNKAIFKDEFGGKITMTFSGNKIDMVADNGAYCGRTGFISGLYIKKNK